MFSHTDRAARVVFPIISLFQTSERVFDPCFTETRIHEKLSDASAAAPPGAPRLADDGQKIMEGQPLIELARGFTPRRTPEGSRRSALLNGASVARF